MTEALYLYSDELKATATVVSCEPLEDGLWAVQLDKTIFHPQGGGQPSDIGHINGMEVKKVVHTAEGIIHWLMAPVEGSVQLTVNAALRSLNTRLHSAGHIIGLVGDRRGWHATRGNHFPGEARVISEPNDPSTIVLPDPLTFENEVNGIIAQGL
ncbi:alanyl-tRNA editing protein [Parasutterella secunda]|uniref:Alanyl-tRNA editing protein n=1 Tax=Parasutterella secunda TaxID=626947 RepID=A0ABS2GUD2_9BURK|nr:alanyl-tRNA editing protein [Parasutterella secunda]MBM6928327.1 alanyl-tRNA editing protein [Parasutterella secunda]